MASNENFKRLAENRTNKALKMLDLISNLSNKNNYDYTKEDYKKIIDVLKAKIKDVELHFETNQSRSKSNHFKL